MTDYEIKRLCDRVKELWNENHLLGERCNQLLKDKGDLTDQIADIKANCDLAIEGRDIKIKELEEKNTELEKESNRLFLEGAKRVEELEKENAELKQQSDKWFVFETEAGNWGMDIATQYTVDRHNYFYGTENECLKWSVEHKIKDYTGHKYCYDRLYEQLEKAKELLKQFLETKNGEDTYKAEWETEQFLKDIKEG